MVPGKELWSRAGSEWGFALLVAGSVRSEPVMREEEWNKFNCNFHFCQRDQAVFEGKENFASEGKGWTRREKKNEFKENSERKSEKIVDLHLRHDFIELILRHSGEVRRQAFAGDWLSRHCFTEREREIQAWRG